MLQKDKIMHKYVKVAHLYAYAISMCILALAGCAKKYQRQTTEQIQVLDIGKAETMNLAEDVLAKLHFTIDKADVDCGLIRTRPLSGAQFFEFWRGDNVGGNNNLLANLHTIRRTVELDITQQGDKVSICCNVKVQRLSLPEKETTSSARAYDMFSMSSPSLQRLTLNPEQEKAMAWVDLGKDTLLATEILRRIEECIQHQTSHPRQMTGSQT